MRRHIAVPGEDSPVIPGPAADGVDDDASHIWTDRCAYVLGLGCARKDALLARNQLPAPTDEGLHAKGSLTDHQRSPPAKPLTTLNFPSWWRLSITH